MGREGGEMELGERGEKGSEGKEGGEEMKNRTRRGWEGKGITKA